VFCKDNSGTIQIMIMLFTLSFLPFACLNWMCCYSKACSLLGNIQDL
jgi:hypothetical protein